MKMLDPRAAWSDRAGIAANAGLALVFAVTLAVEASNISAYHGNWPFDCAAGCVVCAAALLRGHSRAWAATAALVVSGAAELAARLWHLPGQPGLAAVLALFVLLGSAVRAVPVRAAVAIAAGGAAVTVLAMNVHPAAAQALGLGWGAALAAGLWLRLLDARRQGAIETVRRDERLELARELHDTVAHHLTGVVIQAQAARIAARARPETLDAALAGIESAGAEALSSMRQVIGLLRDTGDTGGVAPGTEQLTDLVDRFASRGPAVRLQLPAGSSGRAWPPEVTTTVYRVVQEALTNVTRHACAASEVTVALACDQLTITVEVTDDAPPASSPRFPQASGYGLAGMRERVEALGGTLSAGPGQQAGWSVLATLPAPGTS